MEFLRQNRTIILRSMGGLMLLISFFIYFWPTQQKALTQNELAAANVARMEAKIKGGTTQKNHQSSKFLQDLKAKQEKHLRYMLIFFMVFGLGFLGYSFIQRD